MFYKEIISGKYEDDEILKRAMELSFRSLFNSFQSLVEDYILIVLKTLSLDISELYFRQWLKVCGENEYLSKEFIEKFESSIKLRHDNVYGENIPTTETLIEFYKENVDMYNMFILDINKFKESLGNQDLF